MDAATTRALVSPLRMATLTRSLLVVPLLAAVVAACFKTDLLVNAFNGGALDTASGDPFHDPNDLATELVATRIRQEVGDGYFGQGQSPSSGYVAAWMDQLAGESLTFARYATEMDCLDGVSVGNLCSYAHGVGAPPPGLFAAGPARPEGGAPVVSAASAVSQADGGAAAKADSRRKLRELVRRRVGSVAPMGVGAAGGGASTVAVCRGGTRDDATTAWVADYVRFEAAVERAADQAASLLAGGLVTVENVTAGASRAFKQTAQYLRDRGWSRSFKRRTLALVAKGGASTGVFTAGATWAVLNLINECTKKGDASHAWCGHGGDDDFRFQMMSGTSTGALVSTVVDVYNTQSTYEKRRDAMTNIAQWFTCSAMNDLYCVRSAPLLNLVRSPGGQDSLLDFDGLTKKLRGAVSCGEMRNSSELILNTTDFRSGRLLALSDQEEFALRTREDVVQGALASAALPFIVRPVYTLPSNYDASVPAAYLDGGIRSEIPIMPVVRRGAERVLVIGSDAPVGGESPAIPDALGMATRYIDVTLSGVIETELAQSQSYAQSLRLAEIDVCLDATAPQTPQTDAGPLAGVCAAADDDCRNDLCQGHWDDLCRPAHTQGDAGAPPPGLSPPAPSAGGRAQVRPQLGARLEPFWKMVTLFRDERRVEPLHGYTFNPPEQRRLFLAGADAVRVACIRVAGLLGIPVPDDPDDPRRAQLASWCAPVLDANVCGVRPEGGPPSDCAGPIPAPAPDLLVDCRLDRGVP